MTGDICAFINSDDVYFPGTFYAVMNHFEQHPESNWVCGDTVMFGAGHETKVINAVVPRLRRALPVVGLSRAATRTLLAPRAH